MKQFIFLILMAFTFACNQNDQSKAQVHADTTLLNKPDTLGNEYKLTAKFAAFDTTVEVLFTGTKDSISVTQKKNYDGFIARQGLMTPDILHAIFEFYQALYTSYKKGWVLAGPISDQELEKYLPRPTTPENLKPFITPAIIHIQNKKDCEDGTIGIEFDCTWDIENGLGVLIKNWKVKQASTAEIAYF